MIVFYTAINTLFNQIFPKEIKAQKTSKLIDIKPHSSLD